MLRKDVFMNGGFATFRRKMNNYATLRSLCYSSATGLTAFAVLTVLIKRGLLRAPSYLPYVALAVAVAVLTPLLYLAFRPSVKRAAVILDREFMLDERVQTMVAFSDKDGAVIELQRKDTEERLRSIGPRALKFRRVWAAVAAFCVSLALFGGAFIVPSVAEPPAPDPIVDDYEKSWRIASLTALIEQIRADQYAEAALKDELILEIEELIDAVMETDRLVVMTAAAVNTVGDVVGIEKYYNTAILLTDAFERSGDDGLISLAKEMKDYDDLTLVKQLDSLHRTLRGDIDNALLLFGDKLSAAISASGVERTDEGFYLSLVTLSNGIRTITDGMSSNPEGDLELLFDDLSYSVGETLLQQADNHNIVSKVTDTLISVFGLTEDDFRDSEVEMPERNDSDDLQQSPDTPPDDDEEQTGDNSGGYGTGETLAGSEDLIYDPDLDDYVKFADVLNKYYGRFDGVSDTMDEELKSDARDYFDSLSTPKQYN